MVYNTQLEQFEGPLDLLLQLIEEQKMDITTVSLAKVTEQFLRYLEQAERLHPEELADFLVVAAKLLLIKSRTILPTLHVEDDDGVDLERQLKLYRAYYEASKRILAMIHERRYSFARSAVLRVAPTERAFRPPQHVDAEDLGLRFRAVLKRLEPFLVIPEEMLVRTLRLRDKLELIRQRILQEARLTFRTLLTDGSSKTEVIVTFLALLELVKQRAIHVVQDRVFDTIAIERRPEVHLDQLMLDDYETRETSV